MDRREALDLLPAFLDGEIASDQERLLRDTLASDPACRAEYECLQDLSKTMRRSFPKIEAPPYLRNRIGDMARGAKPKPIQIPAWFMQWKLAGAGVLAILVCTVLYLTWPGGGAPISLFVLDHIENAQRQGVLQVETSAVAELNSWFAERLSFSPQLPGLPGKLLGGRLCHIGEEPVALAFYDWEGKRLSVFVGDGRRLRVQEGKEGQPLADGFSTYVDRGHTVLVWSATGLTYVLVAPCSDSELEPLIGQWKGSTK
jgi:anti-sigma factor RsiW